MKSIFILFAIFISINCKYQSDYENIYMKAKVPDDFKTQYLSSNKGIFVLNTDYYTKKLSTWEIEDNSHFNLTISDTTDSTSKDYEANCRLWYPEEIRGCVQIFCTLKDQLPSSFPVERKINIDQTLNIIYKEEYNINLDITNIAFKLVQASEGTIPFLYSDVQYCYLQEADEYLSLKFRVDSYNNEPLFLQDENREQNLYLDNCQLESNSKNLTCKILKEQFYIVAKTGENYFFLYYMSPNSGYQQFISVSHLSLYPPAQTVKEDLYVEITKLLTKKIDNKNYITYETNVTNIPKLKSAEFEITFNRTTVDCFFIKNELNPLYLNCYGGLGKGNWVAGNIENLENIHYKYNFIIGKRNNELVEISNKEGTFIYNAYPQILDFTTNNTDSLIIRYAVRKADYLSNIKLNVEKDDLTCYSINNAKECMVPKSHFDGKSNGYYFTHHKISTGDYIPDYDIFAVKVILSSEETNWGKINHCSSMIMVLLSLILF